MGKKIAKDNELKNINVGIEIKRREIKIYSFYKLIIYDLRGTIYELRYMIYDLKQSRIEQSDFLYFLI